MLGSRGILPVLATCLEAMNNDWYVSYRLLAIPKQIFWVCHLCTFIMWPPFYFKAIPTHGILPFAMMIQVF